jgi:hypothetical protein
MTTMTTMTTTTAGNAAGAADGGNKVDALVLKVEATSTLKLKNGNDDGIVVDGSLLEDAVMGIGEGAMNGNSPTMKMMMSVVIIWQIFILGANA